MKEMYCVVSRFALLLLLISETLTARAQLVADGASKLINGTTTNVTGDLVIGTNGAFTTLIITNAGMVTNTGNGTIGLNTSAKSNQVIVVDDLSLWGMGGNLVIGNAGASKAGPGG